MAISKAEILDAIANMTVLELSELIKEMDLHKKRAESYNLEKLMKELTQLESEYSDLVTEDWMIRQRKNN